MTEKIYVTVRRTWGERLFTTPWRPLQATRKERDLKAEEQERRARSRERAATEAMKLRPAIKARTLMAGAPQSKTWTGSATIKPPAVDAIERGLSGFMEYDSAVKAGKKEE